MGILNGDFDYAWGFFNEDFEIGILNGDFKWVC